MSSINFPSPIAQLLSTLVHFIGATILTHCLSRRLASESFSSFKNFRNISFARLLIILVFTDSWLFIFSSSIVTFGIGMGRSLLACSSANYICTFFYATSKALIYEFLVEKMHLVWEPVGPRSRFKSPLYIICSLSMLGYLTVFILMLVARARPIFDENGICTVGLKVFVSTSVLAFDLYVNVLLTALFVIPLWRPSCRSNSLLRRTTIRTLVAAVISLTVSTANVLALTLMDGRQPGWVCLGSCALDIVINTLALFWVTSSPKKKASMIAETVTMPVFKTPSGVVCRSGQADGRVVVDQDTSCQIFVTMSVESDSPIGDGSRDDDSDDRFCMQSSNGKKSDVSAV